MRWLLRGKILKRLQELKQEVSLFLKEKKTIPLLKKLSLDLFLYGLSYLADIFGHINQRWIRGHKARGQGHKKLRGQSQGSTFRGQTLSRPRTGIFKAEDHGYNGQVFSKKSLCAKIAYFLRHFRRFSKKKGLRTENCKFFVKFQTKKKRSWPWPIFNKSKNSAVLGRGQDIFEDLEASRPWTSKCVL